VEPSAPQQTARGLSILNGRRVAKVCQLFLRDSALAKNRDPRLKSKFPRSTAFLAISELTRETRPRLRQAPLAKELETLRQGGHARAWVMQAFPVSTIVLAGGRRNLNRPARLGRFGIIADTSTWCSARHHPENKLNAATAHTGCSSIDPGADAFDRRNFVDAGSRHHGRTLREP